MKKRKKIFSRKSRKPGLYGLELAILCALLMAAAYVGNMNRPAPAGQAPVAQRKEAPVKTSPSAQGKETKQRAEDTSRASSVADGKTYRLSRASDGDSFELKDENNRKVRVRLYGIDAPESNQRFGRESREHLQSLMKGRNLRLKTMYLDNYQRSVAVVYLSDKDGIDELSINQRQVQAGMAWVYDYFCTSDFCNTWKLEEAMAQKQKIGLWKDPSPTPPWQWRRSHPRR